MGVLLSEREIERERYTEGERERTILPRWRARGRAYAVRLRERVKYRGSLCRVLVRFCYTIIPRERRGCLTSIVMGSEEGGGGRELKPVLEPGVLKAFVAGLVVGNLNKGLVLGFMLGALGGVYVQQNFSGMPDVRRAWQDLKSRWRR